MAWQILAEVRVPITTNLDAGIKYRHFETGKLKFGSFCETGCGTVLPYLLSGKYRSNSFMASLVYNFWSPPPPPPATQTYPDGSVIPATATCPAPAPPPPPPPAPERASKETQLLFFRKGNRKSPAGIAPRAH